MTEEKPLNILHINASARGAASVSRQLTGDLIAALRARHVRGFVGITDIEFIGAKGADRGNHEALDAARARIAELVHLSPRAA